MKRSSADVQDRGLGRWTAAGRRRSVERRFPPSPAPLVPRLLRPRAARVALAAVACGTAAAIAPHPAAAQARAADSLFTTEKYLDFERVSGPQISPDGARIVYTRTAVNRLTDRWDSALWLVAADGSRHQLLTKGSSPSAISVRTR